MSNNSSRNVSDSILEASEVSMTLVLVTGILGVFSLVGFTGNVLAILVIRRLRSFGVRSSAHMFILHLALSDVLVCCMSIPLTISINFISLEVDSVGSKIICKIIRYFQFLAPTISIAILTTIAIDRFFALVRPLNQSSRVRRPKWMITFAWIFSFVLFVPSFFLTDVIEMHVGDLEFGYCTTIPNNSTYGLVFLLVVAILCFVLPLAAISYMYAKIVRVVWFRHSEMPRNRLAAQEGAIKTSRKKVLKMFIIVIVVFVICWLPFVIYCGFIEMHVAEFPNPGDMIRIVTYCLGLSNSFCNPFVYFFSIDWIRKACRDMIYCRESQEVLLMSSKMSSSPLISKRLLLHHAKSPINTRSNGTNGTANMKATKNQKASTTEVLFVSDMVTSL